MAKLQIKKGDTVVVISGKDKGKQGTVIATEPKKERVFVEGVNTVKRHTKPSQANPQGGIVTKEAGIHVSNVMVVDPETKTATRIKKVEGKDGKFVRATVKSGTVKEELNKCLVYLNNTTLKLKRVCKKNSNTATLWKSLNWKKSLSTSALVMQ